MGAPIVLDRSNRELYSASRVQGRDYKAEFLYCPKERGLLDALHEYFVKLLKFESDFYERVWN